MGDVSSILGQLKRARTKLEAAAHAVPAERWRQPPRSAAWSAAEVIAHLTMVERAITDGAGKVLSKEPRHVPLWKRLHAPPWLAAWRVFRARTPIPVDPKLLAERGEMLSRLGEQRQHTISMLEQTRECDLRAYRWPHPFFGSLSFYQWFKILAYHEARHTKQIREIVETFQE